MKEKKGRQPLRKTVAYMHRMVNSGKWKANSRIPTLSHIAGTNNVSVGTVRKAVRTLENERLLNNNGSFGFCVVPQSLTNLYYHNRPLYYIRMLKMNMAALEAMSNGGKPIGKFIIAGSPDVLSVTNVISGETIITSNVELEDVLSNPIHLSSLIALSGARLEKKRAEHFQQEKLREIARVVLKVKEFSH